MPGITGAQQDSAYYVPELTVSAASLRAGKPQGSMSVPMSDDYSLETLSGAVHYNEWIYALMCPYLGNRVLELGTGIGNHTPYLLREGREVVAIDVDPKLIRKHRQLVPNTPNLTVLCTSIQQLAEKPNYLGSFDCVLSSNVLEHIPDGVDQELVRSTYAVLREGGYAVHWVPACQFIFGSLDTAFGHHRRYSRKSATALFKTNGFEVLSCSYWNLPGFFSWWLSGRVLKMRSIDRSSALAYDRFVVPIIRRIEPWMWRPFGQSLFIVARKPSQETGTPPFHQPQSEETA